ncbi:response regulator transcription factor [Actinomadura graeca]|uniref:Response regulator transcription factor n=1 Tax=Actinomadura graeca TaxID=2750812 RepID=A0ABX8QXB7_9ACTN|nr:LuxR C-terminal-related transcriptional regulator [Actinomadura graeca]QXJ22372.1 response regulator transcription factor [Actinomadura graeca]
MPENTITDHLNVVIYVKNVVVGRGLEAVLHLLPRIRSVSHCTTRPSAETAVAGGDVDVLVVTSVEGGVAAELAAACPRTKVLLLLDELEAASGASFGGAAVADGFLIQQDLTAPALGEALDRMMLGEMPMPARIGRELLARAGSPVPAGSVRPAVLTPRETETLMLLAEGMSNKQIARRLSISDHGAKRLVTSVMLKLGAPNRTAAVVIAIKQGMVSAV